MAEQTVQVEIETERDARRLLAMPLIFGNDEQIRAIDFIRKIDEADEKSRSCRFCEGKFWDGSGRPIEFVDQHSVCECVNRFKDAVLQSLFRRREKVKKREAKS